MAEMGQDRGFGGAKKRGGAIKVRSNWKREHGEAICNGEDKGGYQLPSPICCRCTQYASMVNNFCAHNCRTNQKFPRFGMCAMNIQS